MTMKLDTPCIGICSTVYGDKVCRGCKRRFNEVIDWLGYSTEQKQAVYDRLNDHMVEIVGQYVTVQDPQSLRELLDRHSIRYRDDQHPLTWALHALMFAGDKIADPLAVGFTIHPTYAQLPLNELCNTIDKHLYAHSEMNSR